MGFVSRASNTVVADPSKRAFNRAMKLFNLLLRESSSSEAHYASGRAQPPELVQLNIRIHVFIE